MDRVPRAGWRVFESSVRRRPRSLLVLLPVLLACLGILLLAALRAAGGFADSGSRSYALIAESLVRVGVYSLDGATPTAYRPPAYPLFLAAAMALGGERWPLVALLGQAVIAAACLALTALTARRVFADPVVTAASTLLVAVNLPFVGETLTLRETGLFTLLTLLFVLTALGRPGWLRQALALGAVTALALLTRPSGIVLLPLAVLVLACRGDLAPAVRARAVAACLVAFAVCTAPWQLYLQRNFDRFSLTGTSTSGLNLFKGNHPLMGELYNLTDVDRAEPAIRELVAAAGHGEGLERWEADDHLQRLAKASILADPGRFVERVVEKAIAFFSPAAVPVGRHGELALEEGTLVVRAPLVVIGTPWTLYHLFVVPVGLLALAVAAAVPGRRRWGLCVGALVAGSALIYAVTFPERRFRYSLEPLLAIAAVGFVVEGVRLRLERLSPAVATRG